MNKVKKLREDLADLIRQTNDAVIVAEGASIQHLQDAANHLVHADVYLEKSQTCERRYIVP